MRVNGAPVIRRLLEGHEAVARTASSVFPDTTRASHGS